MIILTTEWPDFCLVRQWRRMRIDTPTIGESSLPRLRFVQIAPAETAEEAIQIKDEDMRTQEPF